MTRVDFSVESDARRYRLWIAEGDRLREVPMSAGEGSLNLPSGRRQLVWSMIGNGGSKITIKAESGGAEVLNAGPWKIPPTESSTGGFEWFDV